MKVKYDPEADILIFILRDRPPVTADCSRMRYSIFASTAVCGHP